MVLCLVPCCSEISTTVFYFYRLDAKAGDVIVVNQDISSYRSKILTVVFAVSAWV